LASGATFVVFQLIPHTPLFFIAFMRFALSNKISLFGLCAYIWSYLVLLLDS